MKTYTKPSVEVVEFEVEKILNTGTPYGEGTQDIVIPGIPNP